MNKENEPVHSKKEIKFLINDQDSPKSNERKKRKHISTWVGTFKAGDIVAHVDTHSIQRK